MARRVNLIGWVGVVTAAWLLTSMLPLAVRADSGNPPQPPANDHPYDVRRFGAIPNDGKDDSAAFQKAMDACLAAAGQDAHGNPNATETYTVHVPIGAFNINSTVHGACSLEGESRVGSNLIYDGTAPLTMLRYDTKAHFSVKNLSFGTLKDGVRTTHLHLKDSVYFHVEDVSSFASHAPFRNNRVTGIFVEGTNAQLVPPRGNGEITNYLYTATPDSAPAGGGAYGIHLKNVEAVVINGFYNIEEADVNVFFDGAGRNTITGQGTIGGGTTANLKLANADANTIIGVRLTQSPQEIAADADSENNVFIGVTCFNLSQQPNFAFCGSGVNTYGVKPVVLSGGDHRNVSNLNAPVGISALDPTVGGLVNSQLTIGTSDGSTGLAIMNLQTGARRFAVNPNVDGSWTMYDGTSGIWNKGLTQQGGNVNVEGSLKALKFVGDGSGLTNLPGGPGNVDLTPLTLDKVNLRVGVGKSPGEKLDVNGTVKALNFMGDGSGLTNLSVGNVDLTPLTLDKVNLRVGVGKSPGEKLDVNGTVKATKFMGDGSGLTNLPGGGGNGSLDVLQFGAVCDGHTNDTDAIMRAIAAANVHGGIVLIPSGQTCLVTQLNLGLASPNAPTAETKVAQGVTIKGTANISADTLGPNAPSTILINPESPTADRCAMLRSNTEVNGGLVAGPNVAYVNVEDVVLRAGANLRNCIVNVSHTIGADISTPGGDPHHVRFRRVTFVGNDVTTRAGLFFGNPAWLAVEQSVFSGATHAVEADVNSGTFSNGSLVGNLFYPARIALSNTLPTVFIGGAVDAMIFTNNSFEGGPNGLYVGTLFGGEIANNWFNAENESAAPGRWMDLGCVGCTVRGNWMTSGDNGIHIRAADSGTVTGNYFIGQHGTPIAIHGDALTVHGNVFQGGRSMDQVDIDVVSGQGGAIGPNSYIPFGTFRTKSSIRLGPNTSGTLSYDRGTDQTAEQVLDQSNGRWLRSAGGQLGPLALDSANGRVGIGTSDSTENGRVNSKLTVRQTDGLTGLAVMNQLGDRRFALNPNTDGSWTLYDGVNGAWNRGVTQHAGNVGIGTTAIPTQKLDVNGTVKAARFIGDGSGLTNLPVAHLSPLTLDTTNGRVGIGTATPSQMLHIDGGNLRINNAGVGNIQRPDDAGVAFQVTNGVNTSFGTFQVNTALGNRTNLVVQNGGRVGIGTTNPAATLHVEGQCVTGDTLLAIAECGMRDAGCHLRPVPIKGVQAGMLVYSLNEATGTLEPHRINGLLEMGVQPVFELETEDGRTIRTTGNHPYLVKTIAPLARADRGDVERLVADEEDHPPLADAQAIGRLLIAGQLDDVSGPQGVGQLARSVEVLDDAGLVAVGKTPQLLLRSGMEDVAKHALGYLEDFRRGLSRRSMAEAEIHEFLRSASATRASMAWTASGAESVMKSTMSSKRPFVMTEGGARTPRRLRSSMTVNDDALLIPFKDSRPSTALSTTAWRKVIELAIGDEIAVATADWGGATFVKIARIAPLPPEPVYDIEVEGTHNFVANGVIAHNTYLSGNVGIGAANPTEKVEIAGTVKATKFVGDGSGLTNLPTPALSPLTLEPGTGRVGIGTAKPSRTLHVRSTQGDPLLVENDGSGNAVVQIKSAQNAQRAVNFLSAPDNNAIGQIAVYGNLASGGQMAFRTTPPGGAGPEAMRLDPNGNLGLGTSDPLERGAVRSKLTIRQADGLTGLAVMNQNGARRFAVNPNADGSWTLYDGASYDGASGSWRPGLTQKNGRVGIGTASPKTAVHVAGGDVYTSNPGAGVILKSPNGARCKKLSITNAGVLLAQDVPCP